MPDIGLSVTVSPGATQASLSAPAGLPPAAVAFDTLRFLARDAGVALDPAVDAAIAEFARRYGSGAAAATVVLARSTPAVRGLDGRVEWAEGYDPRPRSSEDEGGRTNHYAGRRFVPVRCGDIVATIHPPTPGTDGRDVRGGVIKAAPGKPAPIRVKPSLTVDSAGRVVAQAEGVLLLDRGELSITSLLEIPGSVDFSTGNVDFPGGVSVRDGVRSGFSVKSGGALQVGKLIEVSDIECGADFEARGGMAGNSRGSIRVGANARVTYLEKVAGVVGGNLGVDRELVDCRLTVGGDLTCPGGTIMGGEIVVGGSLVIASIGSEAGVPTTVVLGDLPLLSAPRAGLVKQVAALKGQLAKLEEHERQLRMSARLSAGDKERLTEIGFEAAPIKAELLALTTKLDELDEQIRTRRKLDVRVSKVIYPGVTLRIGDVAAVFTIAAKGPMSVCWDSQGQPVYRSGQGAATPLGQIARLVRSAAAPGAGHSPRTSAA